MTRLVSWGVIIVNWLTIGSAEAENNLTTLMTQRNDHSNPKSGHLNTTTYNKDPNEQELQMRTRQASATTAARKNLERVEYGVGGGQRELANYR